MIDQNTKTVIEACAQKSHDGLITFPEVLGQLVGVGVQSYFVDYRLALQPTTSIAMRHIKFQPKCPPFQSGAPLKRRK